MTSRPQAQPTGRVWQLLTGGLVALLALAVAHDVDHLVNQDTLGGLGIFFWLLLPVQYAAFGLTLWLVATRDPRAAGVATLLCATVLVGFVTAHVLPFGLAPYSDTDPGTLSWALVFAPVAVAAFSLVAALRLRAQAPLRLRPGPHQLGDLRQGVG